MDTLGALNFMDPLKSELSEFHRILVSLKPAFTIKNNWEFQNNWELIYSISQGR